MNKLIFLKVYALVFFFSVAINAQQTVLVHSIQEFNTAVSEAKPGTNIVLANGVWQDAELLFEGEGSVSNPIKLSAEEKGKVTLEIKRNITIRN